MEHKLFLFAGYARTTSVSVDRTVAEVKDMLRLAGADRILLDERDERADLMFMVQNVPYRLSVRRRPVSAFTMSPAKRRRTMAQAERYCQQEHRARWRAVALQVKAGLVGLALEVGTFHELFAGYMLMAGGQTVTERMIQALSDGSRATPIGALPPPQV
jgi:hypothetical protein